MLRRHYPILIPLLLMAGCAAGGGAEKQEAAQEAVNALQSVDSAISIGTNVTGYGQLLIPAKTEVDQYIALDSNSELADSLQQALTGHRLAFEWWQCNLAKSDEGSSVVLAYEAQQECREELLPNLYALDPEFERIVNEAVEAVEERSGKPVAQKSSALDPDAVLKLIWQKTSADTEKAAELLAK